VTDPPAKPVTLVDLGLGNVRSVVRALEASGGRVEVTDDPARVRRASRLVVPGQGAFRDAARALTPALRDALGGRLDDGAAYLGICLGMQVLFEGSDESPGDPGLARFPGRVVRLPEGRVDPDGRPRKVPHMGWNQVRGDHAYLPREAWFYFTHSYVCQPADPALVVASVDYGDPLCAAVGRGPVFGCQFHPEKSQRAGRDVLRRFIAGETAAG